MCSAPLPGGPENPVLTRMLALAPYQMPVKEGEAESEGNKDGPYSKGASDIVSRGIKVPSSEEKSEGGALSPFLLGREGPPLKMGRRGLLNEARCLCWMAQV